MNGEEEKKRCLISTTNQPCSQLEAKLIYEQKKKSLTTRSPENTSLKQEDGETRDKENLIWKIKKTKTKRNETMNKKMQNK